ncbi:MAG: pantetheine-phosphate adenylyltransferase [Bacteroidales bacterium]|jgi:pantetheine-phosphate adenylyltransferase|nr:pantetheine-phosphate adenylyltransferase [Bacteroidales bacterium]HHT52055.1 pantetheine-phosphate adenylyltransferase [Bacteroidales bacterium]
MKIALFPGSFDPFTKGHEEIVNRALSIFDQVVVAIGIHHEKKSCSPIEERIKAIENCFPGKNVKIIQYDGLTGELCQKMGIQFIVRGVRNSTDYEYERSIAITNQQLFGVETLFLMSDPQFSHISSTIVRDLIKHGGDISSMVPNSSLKK